MLKRCLVGVALILCVGCTPTVEPVSEDEIQTVIDQYVQAVNTADYDLLREVWIPSDEISYVNPLGRLQSSEQLEEFWQAFITDTFSERELKPSNVAIHPAGSGAAWAVFDWEFDATMTDGQPFHTTGWETQIYRLTDAGWRIEHVHYSTPPAE